MGRKFCAKKSSFAVKKGRRGEGEKGMKRTPSDFNDFFV